MSAIAGQLQRMPGAMKVLLLWLLFCLVLLLVGSAYQRYSQLQHLSNSLYEWMPGHIQGALKHAYVNDDPQNLFIQRTNRVLQQQLRGFACEVQLEQLSQSADTETSSRAEGIHIQWQSGDVDYAAGFRVSCQQQWLSLGLWAGLLSLVLTALVLLLPRPVSVIRADWMRRSLQQGSGWRDALALTRQVDALSPRQQALQQRLITDYGFNAVQALETLQLQRVRALSEETEPWFLQSLRLAARKHPASTNKSAAIEEADIYRALQTAEAEPGLQFYPQQGRLKIHGVHIELPKTPYFYYLWYALRRQHGVEEGWLVNPSVQRPNKIAAQELMQLMEEYGGHRKAINDLEQNGLRAKSLDQNRNKIKEEIVAVLGEVLAADYLFASERDMATGRSRYRLITTQIAIFP